MSTLTFALISVTLLSRLPLLLTDRPVKGREALASWLFQVTIALLITSGLHANTACGVVTLAALHIAINWLWWSREQRRVADLQRLRMVTTLLILLVATVLSSPWSGLMARDYSPLFLHWSNWFSPFARMANAPWYSTLVISTGLLVCVNEATALIRWVIERMSLKPKEVSPTTVDQTKAIQPSVPDQAEEEYKRGRLIGVLERFVLFTLVLNSQYAAVAFVLTAKTMARFKSLDDRPFAEYFLLGTLLSVVLAGMAGLAVKRFLHY